MINIAILFTFHNRKEKTMRCLEDLHNQKSGEYKFKLLFVGCDDASNDGSQELIKHRYNDVDIVNGDGTLFWARGMYRASLEAEKYDPDFYLMVNDDVSFYENMICSMLDSYYKHNFNKNCAIVGSTCDPKTKRTTYGGVVWKRNLFQETQTLVSPSNNDLECNQANWNCFLIPKEIYCFVGRIDDYYEHSMADFDYCNRIISMGYSIFVANKYVGECPRNKAKNTWRDISLPLLNRYKLIFQKNGIPIKSHYHYCKKWYGNFWGYYFVKVYFYVFVSSAKYHFGKSVKSEE